MPRNRKRRAPSTADADHLLRQPFQHNASFMLTRPGTRERLSTLMQRVLAGPHSLPDGLDGEAVEEFALLILSVVGTGSHGASAEAMGFIDKHMPSDLRDTALPLMLHGLAVAMSVGIAKSVLGDLEGVLSPAAYSAFQELMTLLASGETYDADRFNEVV